jgi:hypothetical protein
VNGPDLVRSLTVLAAMGALGVGCGKASPTPAASPARQAPGALSAHDKPGSPPDEIHGTALAKTWAEVAAQSWSGIDRPTYSLSVAPDGKHLIVGVPADMPGADIAHLKAIDPEHVEVVDAEISRN